jgi:hypothetical protein
MWLGALGCAGADEEPRFAQGPTASAEVVVAGTPVQLSVEGTDADGDALRYAWSQEPAEPRGTFSDVTSPSPTWTAPQVQADTRFKLRVRVSDSRGGVEGATEVRVLKATQANVAPVVTEVARAQPTVAMGRAPVQLSVVAGDGNGDALVYSWTQARPATPAGTFSDASARTATWTPPVLSVARTFTLRVEVADGRGGTTFSEVDVEAHP